MMAAPFRSSTLGRTERGLVLVFLLGLLAVARAVTGTFGELERADESYEDISFMLTSTANVQREALLLIHHVDRGEWDRVAIRRQTLQRHLALLDGRLPDEGEARELLSSIEAQLADFDGRATAAEPDSESLHAALHELETLTKQLYDRLELPFFGLLGEAAERRRSAESWLLAGSAGTLLAGAGVGYALRRRYRRAFASAYDRLSAYNEALEDMNEDISSASRAKDDFIATLSHELRTPLTMINGMAETLTNSWRRLSEGDRASLIDGIHRNGKRQQRLVDELMIMAGLVAGRVPVRPTEVGLVHAVESAWKAVDPSVDIWLHPSLEGCAVHVDPEHLHQVLVNLIGNACKYGAPPIEISATASVDAVSVMVRDHGPGIPAGFRPHLFQRFTQAEPTDRRTKGGLGLGLAIVQGLVELNGGTVTCDEGRDGARFTVTVPRSQGAGRAAVPVGAGSARSV